MTFTPNPVDEAERRVDEIDKAQRLKIAKFSWAAGQVLGNLLPPIFASVLLTIATGLPWYGGVGLWCAILSVMPMRKIDPLPKAQP